MQVRLLLLPAITAAMAGAMPASAAELVLQAAPGSNWVVDNGEESCRLVRTFGEGDDRMTLVLTQWTRGKTFSAMLSGKPIARFDPRAIHVAFGEPDGTVGRRPASYSRAWLADGRALVFTSMTLTRPLGAGDAEARAYTDDGQPDPTSPHETAAPRLSPEAIALADRIEFSQGLDTIRLQPDRLGEALGVLDACSQSRLPEWELDRVAHQTMTRTPQVQNMQEVVRKIQENYPSGALDRGEQANFSMRVLVDAAGEVTDCITIAATRADLLNTNACDQFRSRAQFLPALDAAGQPMDSFYTTSIAFRINR